MTQTQKKLTNKTLTLHCPINTTSYGYVSSYLYLELLKHGYDINHVAIGRTQSDSYLTPKLQSVLNQSNEYNINDPVLKIWHQHDLAFLGRGIKIGFPIFELEDFSRLEKYSLNTPDELIVCSKWAQKVILDTIGRKSHILPLGYDSSIFYPTSMPENNVTVFGNFGKFEVRKGHDVLVDIFNMAFTPQDDVCLVMMPHNFFLNQEETDHWVNKYKSSPLGDKIVFVPRQENQQMVYNIMKQIHCGIFPARAEGWNLEALELLAIGRHLIITNVTGHTEFCNNSNSMLVNMESGKQKAADNKFFDGSFEWHSISNNEIDQCVEYMRSIHKLRKEGNLGINQEGISSTGKYTWKQIGYKLHDIIKKVTDENSCGAKHS